MKKVTLTASYAVALIALIISIAWFLRDRDFEPALAILTATTALGTLLFRNRPHGIIFGGGMVFGVLMTLALLFFTKPPALSINESEGEAGRLRQEVSRLQTENSELKQQVRTLGGQIKTQIPSDEVTQLGSQIAELRNQIAGLETEKKELIAEALRLKEEIARKGKTPTPTPIKKEMVNDFEFQLISVKREGSDIVVTLIVTNNSNDRELFIKSYTYMTDDKGVKYEASRRAIGGPNGHIRSYLATSIPTKALVSFQGTAQHVNEVRLLDLVCEGFRVQFKNIAVSD